MPVLMPHNCNYGTCRETALPNSQYCQLHQKQTNPTTPEKVRTRNEPWRKWYHTAQWRNLRTMVLARDPVCMICHRDPSKIADHIKPHKGVWELFCDLLNLQGLCKRCHDTKTATEDGGGGRTPKGDGPVMTGEPGKQFTSTILGDDALDRALAEED